MPHDLLADPVVLQLLEAARRASPAGQARAYEALGAAVVAFAAQSAGGPATEEEPLSTDAVTSLPTESVDADEPQRWHTDEVPVASRPLFDADELDDHTQLPGGADADGATCSLETALAWAQDPTVTLAPPELAAVLVDRLALPADLHSEDDLAVEASRLQWASNELEARFGGCPREAQVALLGLLAARAHHVQARLGIRMGPQLALDRMRRWAVSRSLPMVAGLEADPLPERGSWQADVSAWWEVLRPHR
jgi:hypothetical protein